MPSVQVGPLSFPSIAAAERHIRKIIDRNKPDKVLTGDDFKFCLDMIDMHRNKALVVGTGIDYIRCQQRDYGFGFLAHRTDGTTWDFSWRNCICPPTPLADLLKCLRSEVQYQADEFRATLKFPMICPVSGDTITARNCNIDHAPPWTFEQISRFFIEYKGIDPKTIEYNHKTKEGERRTLKDAELRHEWRCYHRAHASFRAVTFIANNSILRKKPR